MALQMRFTAPRPRLHKKAERSFQPHLSAPGFKLTKTNALQKSRLSVCCSKQEDGTDLPSRRMTLLVSTTFLASLAAGEKGARGEDSVSYVPFEDGPEKFNLNVPQGWKSGEGAIAGNTGFSGASGSRRTLAWFPADKNARDTNVTLTITNVSVEFGGIGSFGTAFAFGTNLVNSMDRSFQAKGFRPSKDPVQTAKLLGVETKKNAYMVEYTIHKPPENQRHLLSLVTLGNNGRYNRLYSLTAQCMETEIQQYRSTFENILNSFQAPHKA